jgi:hypothetical protein
MTRFEFTPTFADLEDADPFFETHVLTGKAGSTSMAPTPRLQMRRPLPPFLLRSSVPNGWSMRKGPSAVLHNAHLNYSKQNLRLAELAPLMTAT